MNKKSKVINELNIKQKKGNKIGNIILIVIAIIILNLVGYESWHYTNKNNNIINNENILSFHKKNFYLRVGQEDNIYNYLSIKNISNDDITFINNNMEIISITSNGKVSGLKKGIAIITAKYKNLTTTITINVSTEIYSTNIYMNNKVYYLYLNETKKIDYEYYPNNVNSLDLKWTSSDNKVVTINNGKITGIRVGKATITLKDNNSVCEADISQWCDTSDTAVVYVVNHKISYEIKENNEYNSITELADKTEINYGGLYTRTYDLRIKIPENNIIYSPSDIDININNLNGSKTTLKYVGMDNSCNCYLYKLTYTFDDTKANIDNYSTLTFTLPDGSISLLEVYTKEAYDCYYACKPVLYLYPTMITPITVSLKHPEYITTSYPKYINNWKVLASPNGNLNINNRNYYALYWDERYYVSKDNIIDFKTGFYVNKEGASKFLEEKLNIIGLTEREANEFIMYWLPILESNEHNLIYFELTTERELNNKININPKPDSLLRVIMHVKKVNNIVNITPQKLITFQRIGFVAVEWGGVQH